jgi:catechol-2,3-dioxygenase
MNPSDQTDVGSFRAVDAGACIGHVHLKVADLERAVAFYSGVLGFEVTQRYGRQEGTTTILD